MFTPDQAAEEITQAVHDHNIGAVRHLLRLLILQDPERAAELYDTLELGLLLDKDRDV